MDKVFVDVDDDDDDDDAADDDNDYYCWCVSLCDGETLS
jgi:hypothetical protein